MKILQISQSVALSLLALAPLLLPLSACQGSDGGGENGFGGAGSPDEEASGGSGLGGSGDGSGGRMTPGSGSSGGDTDPGGGCSEDGDCPCPEGENESCPPSPCAKDEGLYEETGECFSCSPAHSCDGLGETGILLATTAEAETSCICQTRSGYFPGSEGSIAELCDADGDGWVSDQAQPSVESSNAVIRENARCDVRRIHSFYLESEEGGTFDTASEVASEDLLFLFPGSGHTPPGLPLYESARNDADRKNALPFYGSSNSGRQLAPAEVNSLTKACIGITVDANHNNIPDVSEWSGHDVTRGFANKMLESYYAKYTEYGYFLALHDGFWEPSGGSGIYRIVERQRRGGGVSGYKVPLEYPESAPDYVRECKRHPDALFPWSSDELNAKNTVGGDFVRFLDAQMLHHSQFKCVQVTTQDRYGSANAASHPELVYLDGDTVVRKEGASFVSHEWTLNECSAGESTTVGMGANSSIPEITCTESTEGLEDGSVAWAAVNYEHYTIGYSSPEDPGGYVRGCANECADEGAAPGECWGCSQESWGESKTKEWGAECGVDGSCDGAGRCDGCRQGITECKNASVQRICSEERVWVDNVTCQFGCHDPTGKCHTECAPGTKQCSDAGVPQTCSSGGTWSNASACTGPNECAGGNCRLKDGQACSSAGQCSSGLCKNFFQDSDEDGFGSTAIVKYCGANPPAGAANNDDDCCDSDPDAKPGQTEFFSTPTECGGYDYNCDGNPQRQNTDIHACSCISNNEPPGWIYSYPACGGTGLYGQCISTSGVECRPMGAGQRTQLCR